MTVHNVRRPSQLLYCFMFAGGRYESDDIWVKSTGHNWFYEFWIDWALEA